MRELRAAGGRGAADVLKTFCRAPQECDAAKGELPQRAVIGGGKGEQALAARIECLRFPAFDKRFGGGEDYVRIGPAEPERTHCGKPCSRWFRPGSESGRHFDGPALPVDLRTGICAVKVWRNSVSRLHHERDLDQAGESRGSFSVTDVRLDGADAQRLCGGAPRPINIPERAELHGIAERGPGAMRFEISNLFGRHTRIGEGRAHHGLLRRAIGGGDARAASILIDG